MKRNKYRNKLLLAFWSLGLVMSLSIGIFTVQQSRAALLDQIRSNVLSIAVAAASVVDGDRHEEIASSTDKSGKDYREIEGDLRKIRDMNRRDDTYVAFIYTMRQISNDQDQWVYVVDAEEAGEDKSAIGELVTWEEQGEQGDEPIILGEAYADSQFAKDEYGSWLTAYAPFRNSQNEIVGMVGVDLRAEDVKAKRDKLLYIGIAGVAVSLVFGTLLSYLLAKWTTRPLEEVVEAIDRIRRGHLGARVIASRSDEFGTVARAVNTLAESLQEKDALKGALARYVSSDIGKRLVDEKKLDVLDGDRRKVTVLYCESPNISLLAEKLPPKKTVEILNDYLAKMVDIIFHHKGTLDRHCGSGVIAVFGAPLSDDSKELNAINAAIEMHKEQNRLNEKWGLEGEDAFDFGIGIHTGDAILGNIGSDNRVEFTVFGTSVDITMLIEQRRQDLKSSTVISETVMDVVRNDFSFREIGEIQLPGWTPFLRLYTLPNLQFAR